MICRSSRQADAAAICEVINPLILAGGTTAHQTPFDAAQAHSSFIAPKHLIASTVSIIDDQIVGFQVLESSDPDWVGADKIPGDWAVIATFVNSTSQGRGIGRAFFDASLKAARKAQVVAIDATIRADNTAGLTYYDALGFKTYATASGRPLADGTIVDRIQKKFLV